MQVRDDGPLGEGSSSKGGRIWLNPGHGMKIGGMWEWVGCGVLDKERKQG